jgi:membrane protein YqaA with SNARE-associated domain
MPNIKSKRSAIPGRVPTIDQLQLGELALNTYDGRLFLKKSAGGVESIVILKAQENAASASISDQMHLRALKWLEKLGPKACLLSWLPGVGDPLCAVAGWLKMPLLACTIYMAIGKFLRYLLMTSLLLWAF